VSPLLLIIFVRLAHAVPGDIRPATATQPRPPATIEELARDLDDSDRPTRLLAARELRRRVRVAVKAGGRPGSIAELESRAELAALTRSAVPACLAALEDETTAAPCADILARLAAPEACRPLSAAAEDHDGRTRRVIDRSIARLGTVCATDAE